MSFKRASHLVFALFMWILVTACGAKEPAPTTPTTAAPTDEPTLEIGTFGVLAEASRDKQLPYLMNGEGRRVETPCFEPVKKTLAWETQHPKVAQYFDAHREAIAATVRAWYKETIYPKEMWGVDLSTWTIEFDEILVRHVPAEKVAFADDQTCISDNETALPAGSKTVTALFGTTHLRFKSDIPLDRGRIKAMKQAAKKKKMQLVALNAYKPAKDENGKPKLGVNKEKLFNSPTGVLIPKKEVPLPKDRLTVEWKVVMTKPLYVAYGDLPSEMWRREVLPEACEVYLVFDDAIPRVPQCAQFGRAGFGATRAESPDNVIIKVATSEATYKKEVPYNKPSFIQAGGHILVWVTPKAIEEGAHLKIDSLVLKGGNAKLEATRFPPSAKKGKKNKR